MIELILLPTFDHPFGFSSTQIESIKPKILVWTERWKLASDVHCSRSCRISASRTSNWSLFLEPSKVSTWWVFTYVSQFSIFVSKLEPFVISRQIKKYICIVQKCILLISRLFNIDIRDIRVFDKFRTTLYRKRKQVRKFQRFLDIQKMLDEIF